MPLLPESGVRLTYQDYLEIPNDGQRHEIVDGVHYVNAAPATYHQLVSVRLSAELVFGIMKAGLGTVLEAPTDVELSTHDIVQPDVFVVSCGRSEIIRKSRVIGAPDLIVEILSPSTRRFDVELKSARYAACGVSEYWMVDPELQSIEQFQLDAGAYTLVGRQKSAIQPLSFPSVTIDLREVW